MVSLRPSSSRTVGSQPSCVVVVPFKIWCGNQARNVALATGIDVVDAQDIVALAHQPRTQMRAEKSSPPVTKTASSAIRCSRRALATSMLSAVRPSTKHHAAKHSDTENVHPGVRKIGQRRVEQAGNDVLNHKSGSNPARQSAGTEQE
jgi:hypothetical protein